MYFPGDEQIARSLQNELNSFKHVPESNVSRKGSHNPIDSDLELSDPTPSIQDLFVRFDEKFFWGSLGMVQVLWSNRMTKCAGMCYFEGRHGLCKITLSAPLLSLRPRKDLVETLLHEMIHAYLFVTDNYRDRDDHGPEFHKHMYRINKEAGTNITVYHTFLDEVEYYQQHIWRCDGPCRFRKPYFGFVKRAMNRAPGPYDSWWKRHKMECTGTFIKISEPEKKPKKDSVKTVKSTSSNSSSSKSKDIRDLLQNSSKTQNKIFSNSSNRLSDTETVKSVVKSKIEGGATTGGVQEPVPFALNKENILKFPKVKQKSEVLNFQSDKVDMSKSQDSCQLSSSSVPKTQTGADVRCIVRNVWCNRFLSKSENVEPSVKKRKTEESGCSSSSSSSSSQDSLGCGVSESVKQGNGTRSSDHKLCPVCNKQILSSEVEDHLESCLNCSFTNGDEAKSEVNSALVPCPCCYKWFSETQINNHVDECLTIIALKEEILNS